MLSYVKRIFIFLFILTVAAILGLYLYSKGRTYYNSEEEIGNTAGNIYNGGLFCEQDDIIYFSNDYDNGSLYSMTSYGTNIKKITNDKAVFINADENYIYYVHANSTLENTSSFIKFNNNGIYRIFHNGRNLKVLSRKPSTYLMLKGNYLFFQRYDVEKGFSLYQCLIDTTKERRLVMKEVIPALVKDNTIYYTDTSEVQNINLMNLSSFTAHIYAEGSYLYPIFVGGYIYYIDQSDHNRLYRMNEDGSSPTLLVKNSCSTYNITNSGKYLYYQVNTSGKNRICRLNLETMKSETLQKGKYKQIHVTDNYVFFKDLDNANTYYVLADGDGNVNTFNANIAPSTTPSVTPTP